MIWPRMGECPAEGPSAAIIAVIGTQTRALPDCVGRAFVHSARRFTPAMGTDTVRSAASGTGGDGTMPDRWLDGPVTLWYYMQGSAYLGERGMRQASYQQVARVFHILSHPARLRILAEVRTGEACVCHLQAVLKRPQAYVSQQLRVLREASLVANRRDGLLVFYRLDDAQVGSLLEQVLGPPGPPTRPPACPCAHCQDSAARAEEN